MATLNEILDVLRQNVEALRSNIDLLRKRINRSNPAMDELFLIDGSAYALLSDIDGQPFSLLQYGDYVNRYEQIQLQVEETTCLLEEFFSEKLASRLQAMKPLITLPSWRECQAG